MTDPRLLRGAPLRAQIIGQVKNDLEGLPPIGKLVSIANVDEVKVYIRNQKRLAEKAGIQLRPRCTLSQRRSSPKSAVNS